VHCGSVRCVGERAYVDVPFAEKDDAKRCGARGVGASPAQVGLRWLLARRDNVLLIPGTSRLAHLEENMKIADVTLFDDDIAELDKSVEGS